ncbi:MAG: hypothetical protein LBG80_02590 [Bacteroidales bacterium]|jgi:hypothetical protein|nr:hypothetical protein [Bacteroidales bacterium]
MKSVKSMTLRANESAMKEADKGILRSGHKNLGFRFLLILTLFVNIVFFNSCNKEDYNVAGNDDVIENTNNSSLEVRDFKNWFESQNVTKGLIGDQEPDWGKAELKILPDGYNSLLVSIEIYKGKNSLGNDSIRELQIMNVKNEFIGGVQVFSFFKEESAHTKYYNFDGQILEEGIYYTPKQLYILLKEYTYIVKQSPVRLKSGNESDDDPCADTVVLSGTATPQTIFNETTQMYDFNLEAYNCHAYVWGQNDTCNISPDLPLWNNCPDIASSGYSEVSTPQVGDRWVSYKTYSNGYRPCHSAFVEEVVNEKVTKVKAKCAEAEIKIYNPNCSKFAGYLGEEVKYYRK